MPMTFICPMPPTTNNAYLNIAGRGRVLSSKARAFKETAIILAIEARKTQDWHYEAGNRLQLSLTLYFNKNGKRDLSNRIKLVEDALAEALGFDDSVIDQLIISRGQKAKEEFCKISIKQLENNQ